jgi:hypothetical protein
MLEVNLRRVSGRLLPYQFSTIDMNNAVTTDNTHLHPWSQQGWRLCSEMTSSSGTAREDKHDCQVYARSAKRQLYS